MASSSSRSSWSGAVVLQPRSWPTLPGPWWSLDAGDHQVEPRRERPQLRAGRPASWSSWSTSTPVSPASRSRREPALVEGGVVVPGGPRVREHGDPAGVGDGADHRLEVGGVAVDVAGPLRPEEAVERLVAVGDHAQRDQRVGDVRAAHRGGLAGHRADVVHVDVDAEVAQPLEGRRQPGVAAVQDPLQLAGQRRVGRVGQVGEQVDAVAGEGAARPRCRAPGPRRARRPRRRPPPSPRWCRGRSARGRRSPRRARGATRSAGDSVPSERSECVWRSMRTRRA